MVWCRAGVAIEDEEEITTETFRGHVTSPGLTQNLKNGDIKNRVAIFPTLNYEQYKDFSPIELFELFFDETVFENIVIETER